jgi:ABC-type lipoprotein export system ATPase subunit
MLAELRKITKSYPLRGRPAGNLAAALQPPVLNGVELLIGEKDSLAITGPSGSGKSTLLNILGTLDRPDSGEVVLNGISTVSLREDELAEFRNRFIGFVFQLHHLLPQLTLMENVLLPVLKRKDRILMKAARERGMSLLSRVGLQDHAAKFPWQLSVGECQRAAVVRALINRPKLLLADEPTGSLDAANAERLGDLLIVLPREEETAVVVVTHSAELAKRMDKVFRLGAGQLNPLL